MIFAKASNGLVSLSGQAQQYCHQGQLGSVFFDRFAFFMVLGARRCGVPVTVRSQNSKVGDGLMFNRHGSNDRMFEYYSGAAQALLKNAPYLENSGVELEGLKS